MKEERLPVSIDPVRFAKAQRLCSGVINLHDLFLKILYNPKIFKKFLKKLPGQILDGDITTIYLYNKINLNFFIFFFYLILKILLNKIFS
jgi:hypothetical protein